MMAKYVKLMAWLTERYGYEGNVFTHVGGNPTKFTRIERVARERYLS